MRYLYLAFFSVLCACSKAPTPVGTVHVNVAFQEPDAPNALWTWSKVEVTLYKNGEGVKRLYANTSQSSVVFEGVDYGVNYSIRASADLERYYPQSNKTFTNVGRNEIENFQVNQPEISRTILLTKVP